MIDISVDIGPIKATLEGGPLLLGVLSYFLKLMYHRNWHYDFEDWPSDSEAKFDRSLAIISGFFSPST